MSGGIIGRWVEVDGFEGLHEVVAYNYLQRTSESSHSGFVLLLAADNGDLWEYYLEENAIPGRSDVRIRHQRAVDQLKPKTRVKDLAIGTVFVLDPPQPWWSRGNLVLVETPPGWAMPEGWDFVCLSENGSYSADEIAKVREFTVRILDEKPPQPRGLYIPTDD